MITVGIAGRAHHPQIADLTARVYVGEGFSAPTAEDSLRDVAERARETTLLCAFGASNDVLGVVSVVREGSRYRQIARPDEFEVRLLAVGPEACGRGVAEQLMRAILDDAAREGLGVVLSTQETMHAAQRLYRRLGFDRAEGRDWHGASGRAMLVYEWRPGPDMAVPTSSG